MNYIYDYLTPVDRAYLGAFFGAPWAWLLLGLRRQPATRKPRKR